MKTKVYSNEIGDCPSIIQNGGLVAVPTETVYGLACNGLNADAVQNLYIAKGRPETKPLSLMVSDSSEIDKYCNNIPSYALKFASGHWPGPFTLVFDAKDIIPSITLAGGNTVGLRCPDNNLTLELIRLSGVPLAAPSANISNCTSSKNADDVLQYFDGIIDAVIDGGECSLKAESTIIDYSSDVIRILRKGFLKPHLIGITGQSGAGKTTVLQYYKSISAGVIDCDELYHSMLETDFDLISDLKTEFPDCFDINTLDRKKLGKIVFSDNERLLTLNRITHNHISNAVIEKVIEMYNSGYTTIAIDAVELISSGISDYCDLTIGIIADPEERIKRIMIRDSIDYERAKARISSQKPDSYYYDNCDIILENNGTEEEFNNKCLEVLRNA